MRIFISYVVSAHREFVENKLRSHLLKIDPNIKIHIWGIRDVYKDPDVKEWMSSTIRKSNLYLIIYGKDYEERIRDTKSGVHFEFYKILPQLDGFNGKRRIIPLVEKNCQVHEALSSIEYIDLSDEVKVFDALKNRVIRHNRYLKYMTFLIGFLFFALFVIYLWAAHRTWRSYQTDGVVSRQEFAWVKPNPKNITDSTTYIVNVDYLESNKALEPLLCLFEPNEKFENLLNQNNVAHFELLERLELKYPLQSSEYYSWALKTRGEVFLTEARGDLFKLFKLSPKLERTKSIPVYDAETGSRVVDIWFQRPFKLNGVALLEARDDDSAQKHRSILLLGFGGSVMIFTLNEQDTLVYPPCRSYLLSDSLMLGWQGLDLLSTEKFLAVQGDQLVQVAIAGGSPKEYATLKSLSTAYYEGPCIIDNSDTNLTVLVPNAQKGNIDVIGWAKNGKAQLQRTLPFPEAEGRKSYIEGSDYDLNTNTLYISERNGRISWTKIRPDHFKSNIIEEWSGVKKWNKRLIPEVDHCQDICIDNRGGLWVAAETELIHLEEDFFSFWRNPLPQILLLCSNLILIPIFILLVWIRKKIR